jgi:GntR family transcriptional regulator, transcriptional repressor for pyruvate dehydrogenase complex
MAEASPAMFINKSQHIARLLLDRIIEENLHPGSSFGTEAELLEQYQVSRPTLREALRILESQGVLSLRPGPNGGIIVGKPSIDVLAHSLSVFLRLHNVPLIEILRARMAIEPALVRDAALHGTEEQFVEMDESIERMEAAKDDDGTVLKHENRIFHNLIARASSNPVLEVFWETIGALASGENENIKFTERNRLAVASSHREIVVACRRRDPDAAQSLMSSHLGELEMLLHRRHKDRLDEPARITHGTGRKSLKVR